MQFYDFICNFLRRLSIFPLLLSPFLLLLFAVAAKVKNSAAVYLNAAKLLHIPFLAIFIMAYGAERGIVITCASAALWTALYPLSFPRKEKKKIKKENPAEALTREYLTEGLIKKEMPSVAKYDGRRKVLAGSGGMAGGDDVYILDKEKISLNHAIGVAEKLRRAKLTVADRLETDNIYRTLISYRTKNALTREEKSSLNGYLSMLLKFTAKYSL